jgi:hypothetical protein
MPSKIKLIVRDPRDKRVKFELKMRKTMEGKYLIFDHTIIDVVIDPFKYKIVALPKDKYDDSVYVTQNRMFEYMAKMGMIIPESVRAGKAFYSMEAEFPRSQIGGNTIELMIYTVFKWINTEREYMDWEKDMENEWERWLTEPDAEESTELGEVPQKAMQGSIRPYNRRYVSQGYALGGGGYY